MTLQVRGWEEYHNVTDMLSFFRNADAVNQMAVCPGNAADPLSSTSESPQNKEVAVKFYFLGKI